MKLTFKIDYHTNWGERLLIVGNTPELGNGDPSKAPQMTAKGYSLHELTVEISPATSAVEYNYMIVRDDRSTRSEWGDSHKLVADARLSSATIIDHWQDLPDDKPYRSSLFTECVGRRPADLPLHSLKPSTLQISVDAPTLLPGLRPAISGSTDALGNWDPAKAIPLNGSQHPTWTIQLPLDEIAGRHVEYKFIVINEADHSLIDWETGENRTLDLPANTDNRAVAISGLYLRTRLQRWRGAGVAIPVFSLRSDKDFGVGDFLDLIPLADWARKTGQSVIQLLPINDTTMTGGYGDSYPYNAISCFALHPMYLRTDELGELSDRHRQSQFDALRHQLNKLEDVDYEAVNKAKNEFTRLIYKQNGEETLNTAEFKKFIDSNIHWLKPYAAFCTLRDRYRTADMNCWEEYAEYSPSRIDRLQKLYSDDFNYVYYVQFHLDRQLRRAVDYAHSQGIALKGDIPIGISRNSVEAWTEPQLFNLAWSAGAPPDDFAVDGQNWGFPTYNWSEMALDNYGWWRRRLHKMAEYFDAYRIDHVLGFFRIWQIPTDAIHGLLGIFNPALPLSVEEMDHNYGFRFNADWMTRPYIADWMLGEVLGDLADRVRAEYLQPSDNGIYTLRPEVATQQRASQTIAGRDDLDEATRRRLTEGLLALIDQVLMIEDPYKPGHYHPRIEASKTYAYKALDGNQQHRFELLYEDFFYHRHNAFWQSKAMDKLPSLTDATKMLCCAEDLGMIPACVPDVMKQLQILSLEIQRMPKDPHTQFADPSTYPYLSVCSTSTHDMAGLRVWWESDPRRSQRFFNTMLHHQGDSPFYAEPWICREIIKQNLLAPSMLCIIPLQDWLSVNGILRRHDPRHEQINFPENPRHYWRYRMHLTIERLLESTQFNDELRRLISESGR